MLWWWCVCGEGRGGKGGGRGGVQNTARRRESASGYESTWAAPQTLHLPESRTTGGAETNSTPNPASIRTKLCRTCLEQVGTTRLQRWRKTRPASTMQTSELAKQAVSTAWKLTTPPHGGPTRTRAADEKPAAEPARCVRSPCTSRELPHEQFTCQQSVCLTRRDERTARTSEQPSYRTLP